MCLFWYRVFLMVSGIGAYTLLLMGMIVLGSACWWLFLARPKSDLPYWRRVLFLFGLAGNTLSLVLFLLINVHALLITKGMAQGIDLIGTYRAFLPVEATLVALVCGAFGRHIARTLVTANGLALAFLWLNYAAISR